MLPALIGGLFGGDDVDIPDLPSVESFMPSSQSVNLPTAQGSVSESGVNVSLNPEQQQVLNQLVQQEQESLQSLGDFAEGGPGRRIQKVQDNLLQQFQSVVEPQMERERQRQLAQQSQRGMLLSDVGRRERQLTREDQRRNRLEATLQAEMQARQEARNQLQTQIGLAQALRDQQSAVVQPAMQAGQMGLQSRQLAQQLAQAEAQQANRQAQMDVAGQAAQQARESQFLSGLMSLGGTIAGAAVGGPAGASAGGALGGALGGGGGNTNMTDFLGQMETPRPGNASAGTFGMPTGLGG